MGNMLCSLSPFQFAVSAQKASLLCSSQRVRATKTGDIPSALRQYGIAKGSAMTKQHVLSIALYCDWQRLSDALRSSFRGAAPSESVNCEFANWSKFLRETVELFGSGEEESADGARSRHHNVACSVSPKEDGRLLHCSARSMYVFDAFKLRVAAPVSTSRNIRMASRSMTNEGILVQFAAERGCGVFDCSWISGHPQEWEHLLFGGVDRVRIECITEIDGNRSHREYLRALTHLQSMLCPDGIIDGIDEQFGIVGHHNIDENDHRIIANLVHNSYFEEYPEYINCCFFAFCHRTTSIVLDLQRIYMHFGALSDLVIHSSVRSPYTTSKGQRTESDKARVNLFRESLLRLFPNLKRIEIRSGNEERQYPLSLVVLLSSIDSASMFCKNKIRIEVVAQWRSQQKRSWIFQALTSSETMKCIASRATKHGLVVTPCTTRKGERDRMEDSFVIDHITNL